MPAANIVLVRGERVTYKFTCPTCQIERIKPTDKKIIGLLEAAGVEWEQETPILLHPESPNPDAPLLTLNDLIDLHKELEEL